MKDITVLIPLQLASTRVKLKNIKPFYKNLSLFDIKAKQLLEAGIDADNVYISSESEDVEKLTEKYGFHFIKRPIELTGNNIKQPDLIGHFLENIEKDENDILWVQVTNPLFDNFREMLSK